MSARPLTRRRLRELALPLPDPDADKEGRGRVLVAGGARQVPGAMVLAGTAALRAGAGKLQMAAPEGVAAALALAIPEGRVFALPQTEGGDIDPAAAAEVAGRAEEAQALLLGPGMIDPAAALAFTRAVLRRVRSPAVVLDAGALPLLGEEPDALRALEGRAAITPHAGEMARLLGRERAEVEADALRVARETARRLGAVVVLKGATTHVAAPDGRVLRYTRGGVGLATSGSGDTLGGILAGLLARGAEPLSAAAWSVYLHGEAGNVLTRRSGPVGFLAHELLREIPRLLQTLQH